MTSVRKHLFTTTIFCSALIALDGTAWAQDAAGQSAPQPQAQDAQVQAQDATEGQSTAGAPDAGAVASTAPASNANEEPAQQEIVITGTIFRRTNTETPSPVTVLSSESLTRRGITNVNDAVRSVSADNSGSIPNGFTNGFGAGGAAASLRGLTVNSTLTLVDGLRMVNYPLADDGQRSFVDLNTIPRVAIERIEVLKDGASSTYGADAIGGVVNVIMRKHFTGLQGTVEGGISQRGDGEQLRATLLAGTGDYTGRGFNFYAGFEFESNDKIYTKDRGFPFNTADLSGLGGRNLNWNTILNSASAPVAVVRPATQIDPNNPLSGAAIPGGLFQLINPSQCAAFEGQIFTNSQGQACEINQYETQKLTIQPKTTRWGAVVRASAQVGDSAEAYIMGSFYRSYLENYPAFPGVRSNNPVRTQGLVLPALLSNGELNPYNPFAEDGQAALLYFRFPNVQPKTQRTSDVIRGVAGITGTFGDGFNYTVDVGAMSSVLKTETRGNIHIPTLIEVINNGTYNFADPLATDPAVVKALLRDNDTTSTSSLYLAQALLTKDVAELAGGPLQVGVGAQIRREELDAPNANARNEFIGVNQVFAKGKHTVSAAFFEISAPVVKQLELQASGRYDHYSEGFSNFSPKLGFKFTPIRQFALRGTFSRGFRAPSFAESGEAGVIGFTTVTPPCVVRIQHGATGDANSCSAGNAYVGPQALGIRSAGNPDLGPEKSRNFTLGLIAQPIPSLSFTIDYYNIKKTDIISQGPLYGEAVAAFYNGQALPPGYSVVTNPVDPEHPNATPTVAIVNAPYVNAASLKTSGIDMSILFQHKFDSGLRFSSQLEATRINKFTFVPEAGQPAQSYVGTLGPFNLSSGAGTPRWRGNWSNSVEFGPATLTATAYYVSGYKLVAEDNSGAGHDDCETDALYSPAFCRAKEFISVDLVGSYKFNDHITGYFNVINLFDARSPLDPANYAGVAANYNPTWAQSGAVGRFFRVGANFKF